MPSDSTPEFAPSPYQRILLFKKALGAYFGARIELLKVEAKEAGIQAAFTVAGGAGALVFALFGYFFLCVALLFALGNAFGGGNAWIGVAATMLLLHLIIAAGGGWLAWQKVRQPVFTATRSEFSKDQQELRRPRK